MTCIGRTGSSPVLGTNNSNYIGPTGRSPENRGGSLPYQIQVRPEPCSLGRRSPARDILGKKAWIQFASGFFVYEYKKYIAST
jgi:hypothetical protein